MSWVWHVAREGDRRGPYKVWWGNLSEKKSFGRLGSKRDDNIKMNLQEVGWGYGLYGSG
jgi:hypothetical protein